MVAETQLPVDVRTKSVSLIGMMGAGKTTIGVELANELGWHYYDNDAQIETEAGKSVAQIFHDSGEKAFRDWEAKAVEEALATHSEFVLSVGGGAVMREETCAHLRNFSWVVWLRVPIDTLIERVIDRHIERPMLEDKPAENMRRLYVEREPIYRRLADLIVDDAEITPAESARLIVASLRTAGAK